MNKKLVLICSFILVILMLGLYSYHREQENKTQALFLSRLHKIQQDTVEVVQLKLSNKQLTIGKSEQYTEEFNGTKVDFDVQVQFSYEEPDKYLVIVSTKGIRQDNKTGFVFTQKYLLDKVNDKLNPSLYQSYMTKI